MGGRQGVGQGGKGEDVCVCDVCVCGCKGVRGARVCVGARASEGLSERVCLSD